MALVCLILFLACGCLIQGAYAHTDATDAAALKEIRREWGGELASNWTGDDPCGLGWIGVSCSNGSVISIDLNGKNIQSRLPPAIGKFRSLNTLSLQKNVLTGTIPKEVGDLTSLTVLKLSANAFIGKLPSTIGRLSNLQVLSLHHNNLDGPLPDLSNFTKLTDMFLQGNNFNGSIPPEIGTFKSLRTLQLSSNRFSGPIPTTIGQLSQLSTLYIDHNMLSGPFPNISKMKSLQYLWVQHNELTGPIPPDIGYLSSLQNLGLENNHFSGSIPSSLMQLSSLPYLFVQNNNLCGAVPDLSGLINLQGMSFTNNSFNLVEIPAWISSMQILQLLFLDNCSLTGAFPSVVFDLHALTQARFDNNHFNGTLDISKAGANLTLLSIENNRITNLAGDVPYKFQLYLGGNPICDSTTFLHPDLCEMAQTRGPTSWKMQISCPIMNCKTKFEVVDPRSCNCTFPLLSTFTLTAPPFRSITGARVGAMERQLAAAMKLTIEQVKINSATFISNNTITAKIMYLPPSEDGKWRRSKLSFIKNQLSKGSLMTGFGNYNLVSLSPPNGMVEKVFWDSKRILSLVLPIFFFMVISGLAIFMWRKREARKRTLKFGLQQELAKHSLQPLFFQYNDIKLATRDFDPSNKLGEGGFGEVYKGTLPGGFIVAVKRLFPARIQQGTQEFVNEVAIITGVLHRNLVKLIGCCVEETERILVYEFVEHNSLYHALYGDSTVLNWKQRFEIGIGTARGLAYLHEDCQTRIVHRDIKASNILLDKNLNPKIADFGLARLFPEGATHVSTRVAGTFGYVAPEYGLYGQLTEKADTFSFGVVLLEIISGRKSITLREEVVLLLDWAWDLYVHHKIVDIADQRLNGDYNKEELERFVHVAFLCTQSNPNKRPRMSHVVNMLLGETSIDQISGTPGTLSELSSKHDNSVSIDSL